MLGDFDSSVLIKRSVQEPESDAMEALLERYAVEGTAVAASTLAWIEVRRAIRSRRGLQTTLYRVYDGRAGEHGSRELTCRGWSVDELRRCSHGSLSLVCNCAHGLDGVARRVVWAAARQHAPVDMRGGIQHEFPNWVQWLGCTGYPRELS